MKKLRTYNIINILAILATTVVFCHSNYNLEIVVEGMNWNGLVVQSAAMFIVHFLKMSRMYLILYGSEFSLIRYIKTYCKVVPISVVIPLKLGELFRMYCYGNCLENNLKGFVVVVLDRFMDTGALMTIIILLIVFGEGSASTIMYFFIIFLIIAVIAYSSFLGIYRFWKKYFIKSNATTATIRLLTLLEMLKAIFDEITSALKGRGLLLFFLSCLAWSVEVGAFVLIFGVRGNSNISDRVSLYLRSALGIAKTPEMDRFVSLTVILLGIVYFVIKITERVLCRRKMK